MNASVWFFEVKNDGFDPDKIIGGGRAQTPEKNDLPGLLRQWAEFKASGFKKPPGVEGGTLLAAGEPEPQCWWASTTALAENEFNLAAGRYKPQVADAAPEEDPADLIRETLEKERSIVAGLDGLLDGSGGAAVKWPSTIRLSRRRCTDETPRPGTKLGRKLYADEVHCRSLTKARSSSGG